VSHQQVHDSPVGWVADHVRRYVDSAGDKGHEWRPGVPTLLLTTVARRSGLRRRTALIYGEAAGAHVAVASRGGAPQHPAWFLNLRDNPDVEIQVRDATMSATARVAEGAERERLWRDMAGIWPAYDGRQQRTDRQIPVVVLDPREA
jgi:deazaflavin-dependent oxidoreductase (nitroreductase family)